MRGAVVAIAASAALSAGVAHAEDLPIDKLSLAETFEFLTNGMNNQGALQYQVHLLNPDTGIDQHQDQTSEVTRAHGDLKRCALAYHRHVTHRGSMTDARDDDIDIVLKHASAVRIMTYRDGILRTAPSEAHRGELSITPEIWELVVERSDGPVIWIDFADRTGADQAADAVRHIKYLCDAHR
jgi:hypothetical protein